MNTLTNRQAKKLGYSIDHGDYVNTCDDRADRYYISHSSDRCVDRRGNGFATIKDALNHLSYCVCID